MTSKDEHQELESLLSHHARAALEGPAPATPHLDDGALARLAEGKIRPTAAQRAHLLECLECRDVLGAAAGAVPDLAPEPRRRFGWATWLVPGFAAAAAAAVVLFSPAGDRPDGLKARGGDTLGQPASVAFLVTTAKGREVLGDGAEVPLSAQLGFRYGNPDGDVDTLTILGYDGEQVFWYYPEAPGKPAFGVKRGPEAINARLPFDIRLAERHRAGKLQLFAAFDVEPEALAQRIEAGDVGQDVVRLTVTLVK